MISREQVFSDEDLRKLKKDINMAPVDAEIHVQKVSALVIRLEAAEKMYPYDDHTPECTIDFDQCCSCGWDAWREACGK